MCENDLALDGSLKHDHMVSKSCVPPLVHCEFKGEFNYLAPSRQLTKLDNVYIFSVKEIQTLAARLTS